MCYYTYSVLLTTSTTNSFPEQNFDISHTATKITDIFSLPDKWSPTFNCRNNTTQGTLVRSFITLLSNQH